MLYKKLVLLFFLFLFFSVSAFSVECEFDTLDAECLRFSNSFVEFNLNFENNQDYSGDLEVELYNKDRPSNKLAVEIIDSTLIKNIEPFMDSGVYVLEVSAFNNGKFETIVKRDFIFDSTVVMPPVILLDYFYGSGLIELSGFTTFGNLDVFLEVVDGGSYKLNSDINGNFKFEDITLKSGINLVKFYSKNSLGIKSEIIERVIFGNTGPVFSEMVSISSIIINSGLEKINERTALGGVKYITSKRNFYVTGKSNANGIVYLNGNKIPVDANGNYGGFVLLNEGTNQVNVEDILGSVSSSVVIEYVNPRFMFLDFNVDKIVSTNSVLVKGSINYLLDFDVYLNGVLVKEFSDEEYVGNSFSFSISNLKAGKNYIYLKGYNSEFVSEIVYYDIEKPVIEFAGFDKISNSNVLYFKILDDLGVDISSLNIVIGSYSFSGEDIRVKGDFYYIDISEINEGTYNYNVEVSDRALNLASISGTLNINSDNTLIETFIFDKKGYQLGNYLFVDSGENTVILKPSKFIAFNKIYLDGVEIIDYEIKTDGEVELNIDFINSFGILKLEFIDNTHSLFNEEYIYYTSDEKPKLDLDYVYSPYSFGENRVRISGEIFDSNFDWNSFLINGKNSFLRYGDYFESYVDVEVSDLVINGNDYFGSNIVGGNFGEILFDDKNLVNFQFGDNSIMGFNGTIVEPNNFIYEYVNSYDGFLMGNAYLKNNFILPVSQRFGIRSINLDGVKSSGRNFNDIGLVNVDNVQPEIYYLPSDVNTLKILIDGTFSPVDLNSLNIVANGASVDIKSYCDDGENIFVNSECILFDLNGGVNVDIEVSDLAGNLVSESFNIGASDLSDLSYLDSDSKIYFSGNDLFTSKSKYFVQGQIRSSKPISEVKLAQNDCEFDDYNFVCYTDLNIGENILEVVVKTIDGDEYSDDFMITYINSGFGLNLDSLTGDNLYAYDGIHYLVGNEVVAKGSVLDNVLVSVLIDGVEYLKDENTGNFTFDIDLSNIVSQKDHSEFDVQLKAEDEFGNIEFSQKLKIMFNRIIETFVQVIVS